jgi:hypothetical protein
MIVYIIKQRQSKNCVWRQKKSPCQVLVILQYCIIRVGFFFFFSGKIFRLPSFLWYVPLLINYLFFFFKCCVFVYHSPHWYFFALLFFLSAFSTLHQTFSDKNPAKVSATTCGHPPSLSANDQWGLRVHEFHGLLLVEAVNYKKTAWLF